MSTTLFRLSNCILTIGSTVMETLLCRYHEPVTSSDLLLLLFLSLARLLDRLGDLMSRFENQVIRLITDHFYVPIADWYGVSYALGQS